MKVTLQTNHGDIVIELDAKNAPLTVDNFVGYVRDGHYDGTIFHRVIDGFMIQGGGFDPGMKQKPTKEPIQNEANNGLSNLTGTVAMARTSAPHSASAQFFINVVNNNALNFTSADPQGYGYCVFGKVIKGMDVVDAIRTVRTENRGPYGDVPVKPVIIEKAILLNSEASQ